MVVVMKSDDKSSQSKSDDESSHSKSQPTLCRCSFRAPTTVVTSASQDSPLLRNPADDHKQNMRAEGLRGHTDQAVLVFRKPAR